MASKVGGLDSGTKGITKIDDPDVGRSDEVASQAKTDLEAQKKALEAIKKQYDDNFTVGGQSYSKLTHTTKKKLDPKAQAQKQKLLQQKMQLMQNKNVDPMMLQMLDQQIAMLDQKKITVAVQLSDEEIASNIAAKKAELEAEQKAEVAEARADDPKYLDISEVFTRAWEGDTDLPEYPHLQDIPEAQRDEILDIVEKIENDERDMEAAASAKKKMINGQTPTQAEIDALKLETDYVLFNIVKNKGEWDGISPLKAEILKQYQAEDRNVWELHELLTSDSYLASGVTADLESYLQGMEGDPQDFAAVRKLWDSDDDAQRYLSAMINSKYFELTFDSDKDDVLGSKIQEDYEAKKWDNIKDPKEILDLIYGEEIGGVKYAGTGAAELAELPNDGKIKSIDFNVLEGSDKEDIDQFKYFLKQIGIKEDGDVSKIFSKSSEDVKGITSIDKLIEAYTNAEKFDPNIRRAINCALADSDLGFDLTFGKDNAEFQSRIIYEMMVSRGEDLSTTLGKLYKLGESGLHALESATDIAELDDIYYQDGKTEGKGEVGELSEAGWAKLEKILEEKEKLLESLGLEDYISEVSSEVYKKVFKAQKDSIAAKLAESELTDGTAEEKIKFMRDFKEKFVKKFGGEYPPPDIVNGRQMANFIRFLASTVPSLKQIEGSDASGVKAREALIEVMDVVLANTPLQMRPGNGDDDVQIMDRKKGDVWTEKVGDWDAGQWSHEHDDANFDIWAENVKAYTFHTSDTANSVNYQSKEANWGSASEGAFYGGGEDF